MFTSLKSIFESGNPWGVKKISAEIFFKRNKNTPLSSEEIKYFLKISEYDFTSYSLITLFLSNEKRALDLMKVYNEMEDIPSLHRTFRFMFECHPPKEKIPFAKIITTLFPIHKVCECSGVFDYLCCLRQHVDVEYRLREEGSILRIIKNLDDTVENYNYYFSSLMKCDKFRLWMDKERNNFLRKFKNLLRSYQAPSR